MILRQNLLYDSTQTLFIWKNVTHDNKDPNQQPESHLFQNIHHDEKALQKIYEQLFIHSHSGIVIFQPIDDGKDFVFVDVNPRAVEIDHRPREAMIGQKVTEVFPGVIHSPIFKGFQDAYQTGKTQVIPLTPYKDNQVSGYRTNTIIKLPNGLLYVVYEDETEAEFSRRLLDATINTIQTVICTSIGGEHLYSCNDYFFKVFGYGSLKEFKKNHECICDFFVEDQENGYIGGTVDGQRWVEYTYQHQKHQIVKTKIRVQEIERIYSLNVEKLGLDEQNWYLVILDDITLQEKYEQSLKREIAEQTRTIRHLYDLLSESEKISHTGVIETQFKNHQETWSNGIYLILEDESHATLPSLKSFLQHVHPDDREQTSQNIQDGLENGEFENVECKIITLSGKEKQLKLTGHFLSHASNKVNRLIMVVQDVTNEKLIEQLTEENQKLVIRQHHLNSLQEMFQNISHHWRQPLNVISMASWNLLELSQSTQLSTEVIQTYLETINRETDYLSQTIDQFKNLTAKKTNIVKLNIKKEIDDVLQLLRPKFTEKAIQVVENTEDVFALATPHEMLKVLHGMIENSLEAIAKRKEQEPDFQGRITIQLKKSGHFAKITIRDNGIGIPDEIAEKIFEPYFTTKFKSRGVGMSLALDRHIINDIFKGDITLHNHGKEGVEFMIEFPCEPE